MNDHPRSGNAAVYHRALHPDDIPDEDTPSISLDVQRETIRLEAAYRDMTILDQPAPEEDRR